MFLTKLRILYYKLTSKRLVISNDMLTPILYENYIEEDYYYIINNNKNLIYSLDEMYEIMKKEILIDPFTQLQIKSWSFVKVSISK